MSKRLGDAPIEARYVEQMNAVAATLDQLFNGENATPHARGAEEEREVGFVLLVFPFGDREGRCNFISNGADRRDLVVMFKELIARFEGQPFASGRG